MSGYCTVKILGTTRWCSIFPISTSTSDTCSQKGLTPWLTGYVPNFGVRTGSISGEIGGLDWLGLLFPTSSMDDSIIQLLTLPEVSYRRTLFIILLNSSTGRVTMVKYRFRLSYQGRMGLRFATTRCSKCLSVSYLCGLYVVPTAFRFCFRPNVRLKSWLEKGDGEFHFLLLVSVTLQEDLTLKKFTELISHIFNYRNSSTLNYTSICLVIYMI